MRNLPQYPFTVILRHPTVRTLIVERYPTRLAAPKAHALSPRSLELCRQFGIDVNEIRGLGSCREDAHWVNFITNLSGKQVGRLPYERMDPGVLDATPAVGLPESKPDCRLIEIDDPQYPPACIRGAGREGARPEASE